MEQELCHAVKFGDLRKVKSILRYHPETNVNWESLFERNILAWACIRGHPSIVSALLAHPTINVNVKSSRNGYTALYYAGYKGPVSCLRLLLDDPRVDVNLHTGEGETPLSNASSVGRLDVVRSLIASGRDLDFGKPRRKDDAIAATKAESWEGKEGKRNKAAVNSLLKKFKKDPVQTRFEVRVGLGSKDEMAAEVFALVVFLCEGFVKLHRKGKRALEPGRRFFNVAKRLPMELQMILCHLAMGSTKESVHSADAQAGFRSVSTKLEDKSGAPDFFRYEYVPKVIW